MLVLKDLTSVFAKKFVKIYVCVNTAVAGFVMVVMQNLKVIYNEVKSH